ncbi:RICIN domain-containing protein [Micromonospora zhanjiangensis]|uniref:RICIN domain-containing protein n=1 Tax=Micromonospora zhanjiangensis TaxID=1522057 RepID=A0ABV8KMM4_9ACTN
MMVALAVGAVGVLLGVLFATGVLRGDDEPNPVVVSAAGATGTPGDTVTDDPAASAQPTPAGSASAPPGEPAPRAFRSLASSLCLAVDGTADPEGAAARQDPCTGAADQLWLATSAGSDWVTLVNSASGRCLDVDDASTDEEAEVHQRTCTAAPNQQWRVVPGPNGDGAVTAVNVNSGKCLTVPDLSTEPGTELRQFTCNGGANQQWTAA